MKTIYEKLAEAINNLTKIVSKQADIKDNCAKKIKDLNKHFVQKKIALKNLRVKSN
jgi:hypothetical protein